MKRTIVYIDGYNLYYGMLKGTPFKWLDLSTFSKSLLNASHEIVAIKYFSAPIKTHPHDPAAIERQNIYLQALSANPLIKVILGFYARHPTMSPALGAECKICPVPKGGLVRTLKLEEKRTDVNIAVAMLLDAAKENVDSLVLVTGDSDQVGAIEAVRYEYKKPILVFNPQEALSEHLKRAATFYRNIPRDLPQRCQLPDEIPVRCPPPPLLSPLSTPDPAWRKDGREIWNYTGPIAA